jgi:hypothetical protein
VIFTFGFAHVCPCGLSLRACYVELSTRDEMVERYGVKWAFEYANAEDAGVLEHQLRRVQPDGVCNCGGLGRTPWEVEREERELALRVFGEG